MINNEKYLYNMGEVVLILGLKIGKNQLYAFLKELHIIDKNNCPYQEYVNRGLFVKHETFKPWNRCVYTLTLVTKKGIQYIRQLLMENNF